MRRWRHRQTPQPHSVRQPNGGIGRRPSRNHATASDLASATPRPTPERDGRSRAQLARAARRYRTGIRRTICTLRNNRTIWSLRNLHHQPHRQHGRPHHGPRPRPGAGRHSPPSSTVFGTTTAASTSGTSTLPTHATHSTHHPLTEFINTTVASTSGNSTLFGHTTRTGRHPGIEISTSISVNLTLPTLPTHSRPRPTELLAVIENFQVLEGSSSLPGATGTIRHAPSPGFPAAGLAGGSDSRVVPVATETVTAQLARFTGGVERVMVLGSSGVVSLGWSVLLAVMLA